MVLQHVPTCNVHPQAENEDEFLDVLVLPPDNFVDNIITYIAGFVVRKLLPNVKCDICRGRLLCDANPDAVLMPHIQTYFDFINLKDCGGLIRPSNDVITVCRITETVVRQLSDRDLARPNLKDFVKLSVLANDTVFPDDHESGLDSHAVQLLKAIVDYYVKVKLHHLSTLKTEKLLGSRIRSKLIKTILFKHQ